MKPESGLHGLENSEKFFSSESGEESADNLPVPSFPNCLLCAHYCFDTYPNGLCLQEYCQQNLPCHDYKLFQFSQEDKEELFEKLSVNSDEFLFEIMQDAWKHRTQERSYFAMFGTISLNEASKELIQACQKYREHKQEEKNHETKI
jgi:hypothetical protein